MNEVDYWVSKVKWDDNNKRIISMYVHQNNNNSVGTYEEMNRSDILYYISQGYIFCSIIKAEDDKWKKGKIITSDSNVLNSIDTNLPLIKTRRKTFVSYYHKDDQEYKKQFLNLTENLIVSKSVEDGDINSDVSDDYAKQLIQKGYLRDTTVLIVLIGPKTKCRKHVDWEISGALNVKVGGSYAGILGLKLPTHSDYPTGKHTYNLLPDRLSDNLKSRYAIIRDYTTDTKKIQEYIELAYKNRKSMTNKRDNSRIQMKDNT